MVIKAKKRKNKTPVKSSDITGAYKLEFLKINFSFLTTNKNFNFHNRKLDNSIKADILMRLEELSQETVMIVSSYGKERGFEILDSRAIGITAQIKSTFYDNNKVRNGNGKFIVFRLYPNNNPLPVRLIGRLTNNIFYLFYIDLEHKCYK